MTQVQSEPGSLSSVRLLVLLPMFVSLKRAGKVRLMLPVGPWARLMFSPQGCWERANILSGKGQTKSGGIADLPFLSQRSLFFLTLR